MIFGDKCPREKKFIDGNINLFRLWFGDRKIAQS